jgi:hypothetical protein
MNQAISVTLDQDNLTWLRGRAGAAGRSVSEILDRVIQGARTGVQEPAPAALRTQPLPIRQSDGGGHEQAREFRLAPRACLRFRS